MQRVWVIILFFCTFLASAADTVLKLYRPFGEVTEQSIPIVKNTVQGSCEGPSQLIVREDAWYCRVGDKVYDPCFAPLTGTKNEVICPQSPWVGDSIAIELAHALNNAHHSTLDMSGTFPWAIELIDGAHCQAIASKEFYDALPVRYLCTNGNVLIGSVQRCKSVWSMLEKTPSGVVTTELSKVWF